MLSTRYLIVLKRPCVTPTTAYATGSRLTIYVTVAQHLSNPYKQPLRVHVILRFGSVLFITSSGYRRQANPYVTRSIGLRSRSKKQVRCNSYRIYCLAITVKRLVVLIVVIIIAYIIEKKIQTKIWI
jgi:hypothetical protein